jgi:hypothetical protein
MAQAASTSWGYMTIGTTGSAGWKNSMWKTDKNISCISLIEVADMRDQPRLITGGSSGDKHTVNVAMDNSLVVTRFLFFFPTGPKNNNFGWKHGKMFSNLKCTVVVADICRNRRTSCEPFEDK